MNKKQKYFYDFLVSSLRDGEYIDVQGNTAYLFDYISNILKLYELTDFKNIRIALIEISQLYEKETFVAERCMRLADRCWLGMGEYGKYLDKTAPKKLYGTSTHDSNFRLNLQKKAGFSADPVDLLLMFGARKTKFIIENMLLYKTALLELFNEYSRYRGNWFYILEKLSAKPRVDGVWLFNDFFLELELRPRPKLIFDAWVDYYATQGISSIIEELSRKAENEARVSVGFSLLPEKRKKQNNY